MLSTKDGKIGLDVVKGRNGCRHIVFIKKGGKRFDKVACENLGLTITSTSLQSSLYFPVQSIRRTKTGIELVSDIVGSACAGKWCAGEIIATRHDKEENISYFIRRIKLEYLEGATGDWSVNMTHQYFPNAPRPDFTYQSFKRICRGKHLGKIRQNKYDISSSKTNNQLFYNYARGEYLGIANLGINHVYDSEGYIQNGNLFVKYHLPRTNAAIKPGSSLILEYAVFAGQGPETVVGRLSNVLWRLNKKKDPSIHVPQTGIIDFRRKRMKTWDLYAYDHHSHFLVGFVRKFFKLTRATWLYDFYGCGWGASDQIKAWHYYLEYLNTKKRKYYEYCRNMIRFYAFNHYVGGSKLTYAWHSGKLMKKLLPFPKKTGWGAPHGDDGINCIDSIMTAEMINTFLELYKKDPSLFGGRDYPREIGPDVLRLQQSDGSFCRMYDKNLKPKHKKNWINQRAEGYYWIPVLCHLHDLLADEQYLRSAEKAAEFYQTDFKKRGLYSLNDCESDYPDDYDLDGLRGMIWAFLALFEAAGKREYLARAEEVQLFGNLMQMGYNTPIKAGTFYHRINWKPKGMICTSFNEKPDYKIRFCTSTGNQMVAHNAWLLMKLYCHTSKPIYAERAIAAMRQVLVFRDPASLRNSPYRKNLLYTIMENNPQFDDPLCGEYLEGAAQDNFTSVQDWQLWAYDIIRAWGGIAVFAGPDKRHAWGVDCISVRDVQFAGGKISFTAENELKKQHATYLRVFGLNPQSRYKIKPEGGDKMVLSGSQLSSCRERILLKFNSGEKKKIIIARTKQTV